MRSNRGETALHAGDADAERKRVGASTIGVERFDAGRNAGRRAAPPDAVVRRRCSAFRSAARPGDRRTRRDRDQVAGYVRRQEIAIEKAAKTERDAESREASITPRSRRYRSKRARNSSGSVRARSARPAVFPASRRPTSRSSACSYTARMKNATRFRSAELVEGAWTCSKRPASSRRRRAARAVRRARARSEPPVQPDRREDARRSSRRTSLDSLTVVPYVRRTLRRRRIRRRDSRRFRWRSPPACA